MILEIYISTKLILLYIFTYFFIFALHVLSHFCNYFFYHILFYTSIFHNLYLKILFSFSKSKPMIIKGFDVHRFFSVFFILYYLSNKSSNTIKLKHLFFCAKNFHLTIFQSFLLNPTKTAFTFD